MTTFKKIVRYIVNNILYKVTIYDDGNISKNKSLIICPNHSKFMDGIIMWANNDNVNVMAKKEIFKDKFLSKILRKNGVFPVDRGNFDVEAIRNSINILEKGNLIVFPHGTRKFGRIEDNIHEIKRGVVLIARKANAGLIPTYITEGYKLFSKVNIVYGKIYIPENNNKLSDHLQMESDKENLANGILECKKKVRKLKK